jgi:1,4-dihydroxy-2-naphthoate octaprenyltransferase
MTFNLLLLNEFPDESADRGGGRKNLVILLGRRRAAIVYGMAALFTPLWILLAGLMGPFPPLALLAALPSLFLAGPLKWAFGNPGKEVPIPALGSNVIWNLATNAALGGSLFLAAAL